jgi:3-deoxy-D-manno-octulosonate 8-phosphate phosphatase (KDO 8-P phosphatase)
MDKAKQIKLLILDVDGTMTNGVLYYDNAGHEMRGFHVHDGLGLKLLRQSGVAIAVISAKNSEVIAKRMNDLKIEHVYLGHENKLPIYEEVKRKLDLKDNQIAYMGDDLPDLPLLMRAGFAITVSTATEIIQQHADYICQKNAGAGAVREACECIMKAQDNFTSMLQFYLGDTHSKLTT